MGQLVPTLIYFRDDKFGHIICPYLRKDDALVAKKEVIEQLEKYLIPIVAEYNCELFDCELVKEGPNLFLRVYIDKEDGVNIEDCENVSRAFSKVLDEKDPIEQQYILEVSSPGIDRPLKTAYDYDFYKGELIDIKLYKSIEKKKEFTGVLVSLEDSIVTITCEGDIQMKFNIKEIASCRLAVVF